MSKAYFLKQFFSAPIRLSDGTKVSFTRVGRNSGVLETESEPIISELTASATAGGAGISVITEAKFEELKKNSGKTPVQWAPKLASDPATVFNKLSPAQKSPQPAGPVEPPPAPPATIAEPVTATGVFPGSESQLSLTGE